MPITHTPESGVGGPGGDATHRSSAAVHVASLLFGLLALVGAIAAVSLPGRRLANDEVFRVHLNTWDRCAYVRNSNNDDAWADGGGACFHGIGSLFELSAYKGGDKPERAIRDRSGFGIQPHSSGLTGGATLGAHGTRDDETTTSLAELLVREDVGDSVATFQRYESKRAGGLSAHGPGRKLVFGFPNERVWESLWLNTRFLETGAGRFSSRGGDIRFRRLGTDGKPSKPEIFFERRVSVSNQIKDVSTTHELTLRSNSLWMPVHVTRAGLAPSPADRSLGTSIWSSDGDGSSHGVAIYGDAARVRCFQLEVGERTFPFRCYRFPPELHTRY